MSGRGSHHGSGDRRRYKRYEGPFKMTDVAEPMSGQLECYSCIKCVRGMKNNEQPLFRCRHHHPFGHPSAIQEYPLAQDVVVSFPHRIPCSIPSTRVRCLLRCKFGTPVDGRCCSFDSSEVGENHHHQPAVNLVASQHHCRRVHGDVFG